MIWFPYYFSGLCMDFEFSWEVKLFSLWEKIKHRQSTRSGIQPNKTEAVRFEEVELKITFLARSLTGENVFLKVGADIGGVHGSQFILPVEMINWHQKSLNRRAWIFRIWFMSQIYLQGTFVDGNESEQEVFIKTCLVMRENLMALQKSNPATFKELKQLIRIELDARDHLKQEEMEPLEQLLRWSLLELPDWQQSSGRENTPPTCEEVLTCLPSTLSLIPEYMFLFGRLMTRNKSLKLPEFIEGIDHGETLNSNEDAEKEAPAMDKIESAEFSKKDQQDSVLMHTFEKVECLDDYNGAARDFDGSDEMEDHHEAMQELQLRQIIRTNEQTHSIYRADIRLHTEIGDVVKAETENGIPYPEWDGLKRRYKKDWCQIYPKQAKKGNSDRTILGIVTQYGKTIRKLKRRLEVLNLAPKLVPGQYDGESIDFDAVVDNHCLIRAAQTPSERIYLKKLKKRRDLSTLILLDLSLSVDSFIDGQKILDICKESLVILAKAQENLGDLVEVAAFYSSTRNECSYIYLKKFHESWETLYERIMDIEAEGYTRIGPALRHATHRINSLRSKKKVIVLLSDGKPNDYDKYEGMYGIRDVRQAIREAKRKDIQIYALAISNQAYDFLPIMLGKGNYSVVKKTTRAADAFGELYQKLLR